MNVKEPAKPICTSSSIMAGRNVTAMSSVNSTAILPATYSHRDSGLAR